MEPTFGCCTPPKPCPALERMPATFGFFSTVSVTSACRRAISSKVRPSGPRVVTLITPVSWRGMKPLGMATSSM